MTNPGPVGGVGGHKYRIVKQVTKIKQRENFLTNRVANNWRDLPAEVINAKSTNNFKNRLDSHLASKKKNNLNKNNRKKLNLLKLKTIKDKIKT